MAGKGDVNRTIDREAYSNHYKYMMDKQCTGCEHYLHEQCRCTKKTNGCLRKEKTNESRRRKENSKTL